MSHTVDFRSEDCYPFPMHVGRVASLHRFPVKSMGGEVLQSAQIARNGLLGDRAYAVRDERAGEIRGAKRLPGLMLASARYRNEPGTGTAPAADIVLPDGTSTATDDPAVAERLSALVGTPVTLWPLQADLAHYRRTQPGARLGGLLARSDALRKTVAKLAFAGPAGAGLRGEFGREPGEPLPDLSLFPAELFAFVSPPGTYFDAFPIHLLTTATLKALHRKNPTAQFDVGRFRPNLVVETEPEFEGFVEARWAGRELTIGSVRLECTVAAPRCNMVTHPQPGLAKDPSVLRTIVREAGQTAGVYARVLAEGRVVCGDAVVLP